MSWKWHTQWFFPSGSHILKYHRLPGFQLIIGVQWNPPFSLLLQRHYTFAEKTSGRSTDTEQNPADDVQFQNHRRSNVSLHDEQTQMCLFTTPMTFKTPGLLPQSIHDAFMEAVQLMIQLRMMAPPAYKRLSQHPWLLMLQCKKLSGTLPLFYPRLHPKLLTSWHKRSLET